MAITKIGTPELFDFSSLNTALKLPTGNTASRPSGPSTGEWRFNTDTKYVEFYDGTRWVSINTEAQVPDPITTDLVLSWDTTQTTGTGSTGNLLALNGTSVTSTDSGSIDKTSASNQDPSGNQGWGLSSSPTIDSNVVMSDSTFFNTTASDWSLEIWCKINSKAGSTGAVFANSWVDGGQPTSKENFIIGLYGASSTTTTGGFHTIIRTGGGTGSYGDNTGPANGPNYGNWSQIVIVADGGNSLTTAYLNGSALTPTKALSSGTPQTSNADFTIGRRDQAGSNGGWNGIFRICRMYKTALTAANVLNNFDANKATFGL
jgi:hypothetical protein